MRKGKYAKKASYNARPLVMLVALVLLVGMAVGGTVAWLTDSESVTNTFTVGNIDITLTETPNTDSDDEDTVPDIWQGKMVPGTTLDKDPVVTVKAGSEASWVFVKVEESSNLDTFITYTIAEGWTQLEGVEGVYYREVKALTAEGAEDVTYNVLACKETPVDSTCTGCVLVNNTVTKEMMDKIENKTDANPTLTFTAYAVQKAGFDTAPEAWAVVSNSASSTPTTDNANPNG